jgi:hypothetical protein
MPILIGGSTSRESGMASDAVYPLTVFAGFDVGHRGWFSGHSYFRQQLRRDRVAAQLLAESKEKCVTTIYIVIPESLTAQKAELESALAGIATEELKLATQRKDIQTALQSISTAVAILSGQPLPANKAVVGIATARRPMSAEAKMRIGEGLRKYREAKALAKAAQVAAPEPQGSAPANELAAVSAPETTVEVPADAPVLASEPQEPAQAPADVPVADTDRKPRSSRKAAKE